MSSPDVMFEASSVCFQYVNKRAAHVKKNRPRFLSVSVSLGRSKSLTSLVDGWFSTAKVLQMKIELNGVLHRF